MFNILVVDDQPYVGKLLSEEFANEDYKIVCLQNADDLMTALRESKPDVVLLELFLDGIEGWQLLKEIKQYDPSLPVLMMSAFFSSANDPRLAGADGYVTKSFKGTQIKDEIHERVTHQ
jgi:DNA-binding response OmpR family regulator